jgi:hypothetical protein
MRSVKSLSLVLAATVLTAVGGCQFLGPSSIEMGRGRYNNVIQSTSMEQTMANIVRVYDHEPPMFMDVTEVDAALSAGGSATGASTNIGAKHGNQGIGIIAGQVGSAGGTIQYSETPTIRYQPLLGQALVAQLVTPVSVDALGLLYDSTWGVAPLLDFSTNYLTPDSTNFYAALDTITELYDMEAMEMAAAQSSLLQASKSADTAKTSAAQKSDATHASNNDSLVFYLLPYHKAFGADQNRRALQLWIRMLRIYNGSQPPFKSPGKCKSVGLSLDDAVLADWDIHIANHVKGTEAQKNQTLNDARDCIPDFVELRIVPAPLNFSGLPNPNPSNAKGKRGAVGLPFGISTDAPLMRTYSALGILKNATDRGTSSPRIGFVTPEEYTEIRGNSWNTDPGASYYTLLPSELDSVDCPPAMKQKGGCENTEQQTPGENTSDLDTRLVNWLRNSGAPAGQSGGASAYPDGVTVMEEPGADVLDFQHLYLNARLGTLRRYVLIVVADSLPSDPVYVSYSDGDRWYYIAKDDVVSQRNFQLLSLFMSMMAIPPSTQPLSPVINVGG